MTDLSWIRRMDGAKGRADPMDLIIDRSRDQKAKRLADMRAELAGLGYAVVTREWLNALLAEIPAVMREDRG